MDEALSASDGATVVPDEVSCAPDGAAVVPDGAACASDGAAVVSDGAACDSDEPAVVLDEASCDPGEAPLGCGRTGGRSSWCRLHQRPGWSIIGTASITVTASIFIIIFFAIVLDHQNGRTLCGGHDLEIMVDSPGKQSS